MTNGQKWTTIDTSVRDQRAEFEYQALRGAAYVIMAARRKADVIAMTIVARRHQDELDEVNRQIDNIVGQRTS